MLGPRFCVRAFSSCGKRGPLPIAVRGPLHYRDLSRCGAQAPDAQAQQLWPTGPAAPRHVGSPQTRARTRVPCISRQTPNHCATREALDCFSRRLYHQQCMKVPISPHPHQHLLLSVFLMIAILVCVKLYLIMFWVF